MGLDRIARGLCFWTACQRTVREDSAGEWEAPNQPGLMRSLMALNRLGWKGLAGQTGQEAMQRLRAGHGPEHTLLPTRHHRQYTHRAAAGGGRDGGWDQRRACSQEGRCGLRNGKRILKKVVSDWVSKARTVSLDYTASHRLAGLPHTLNTHPSPCTMHANPSF